MMGSIKDAVMKHSTGTKMFWRFMCRKKFYLPVCLVFVVVVVWVGIDLCKRWKIAALTIGILIEVLSGCRDVRLFKAS
jgi:hypothetical protein